MNFCFCFFFFKYVQSALHVFIVTEHSGLGVLVGYPYNFESDLFWENYFVI